MAPPNTGTERSLVEEVRSVIGAGGIMLFHRGGHAHPSCTVFVSDEAALRIIRSDLCYESIQGEIACFYATRKTAEQATAELRGVFGTEVNIVTRPM